MTGMTRMTGAGLDDWNECIYGMTGVTVRTR